MISFKATLIAWLVAGPAVVTASSFVSAREFEEEIREGSSQSISYMVGVHDALNGLAFCTPATADTRSLADAYFKWIAKQPRSKNQSGAVALTRALEVQWPCSNLKGAL